MAKRLSRRQCIAAVGIAMWPRKLNAQQAATPVIGVLDSAAAMPLKLSAFYEALKIEGFTRNQNLTVEYHSAAGNYRRLPDLAANLVSRGVSLITAFGIPAAQAAKAATTKIPIVFSVSGNPIENGLVVSLNHPGANVTGVAAMASGRERKRLELLHAAVSAAPLLGVLVNPQNPDQGGVIKDGLTSAQKIGVEIKVLRASTGHDFSNVFAELAQSRAGGLVIADDEFLLSASAELGSLAARQSIPAIFEGPAFVAAGGLLSYGTKLAELYHQTGAYSGLVLAGAAPADLPVFQSSGVEIVANLRSAKALGIALPQAIIDQATTLIR